MLKYIFLKSILLFVLFSKLSYAQPFPELIYYKFDSENTITNYASAPVGSNPAILNGLTVEGNGMFGTALNGTGSLSSTDYVDTGWETSLNSSFTIGFWTSGINTTDMIYAFGDNTASGFRCFTNGVAGSGNWLLRCTDCGMPDVTAYNGATTEASYVHFVYDESASKMRAYFDGVKVDSSDVTSAISINGDNFKVGGYDANSSIDGMLDEFRLYDRALSDEEILETYNTTLVSCEGPSNVEIVEENCDEIIVSWDSGSNSLRSYLEYGPPGFTLGQGTRVETTSNPFEVSGLNAGTEYEFYVVDSCNLETSLPSTSLLASTLPRPEAAFNSFLLEVNDNGAQAFFDASASEDASSYTWIFGDGSTGSGQDVVHYYTKDSVYSVRLIVDNECGSDLVNQDFVVNVVSRTKSLSESPLSVFPNPFNNTINFKGVSENQSFNVEIYDMTGRVVFSKNNIRSNEILNLQNLHQGSYILNLISGEQTYYTKILKSSH
ncbi:LamG-like jellyroll fold domain-containing protein [Cytophagaceae bacterium ABcell3]|nr:LamG-like jellyroll fold domain-containing protein [Cytophagaceae bacterium ABcell3]